MFSKLPGEVVERIASSIEDLADILSFRLVSRKCCTNSYAVFGANCFGMLPCDLSKDDMAKVTKIAKIDGIAHQIRRLRLEVHTKYYPDGQVYGSGFPWARTPSGCITDTPSEINVLKEFLSQQWVNCTSFELVDEGYQREAHQRNPTAGLRPVDVLAILLDVIDKAKLPVKSISLQLAQQAESLLYEELCPHKFSCDPFQGLWGSSLRYLELAWDVKMDGFTSAICRVIARATSLERLALDPHHSDASNEFLHQLTIELADNAPRLVDLRIRNTALIQNDVFQRFLSLFMETLSSLNIYRVRARDWTSTLQRLQKFPNLRSLTLLHCSAADSFQDNLLFFCALRNSSRSSQQGDLEIINKGLRRNVKVGGFRYQGSGMPEALGIIADAAYIYHRDGPSTPDFPDKSQLDCEDSVKVILAPRSAVDPAGW